VVRRGGGGAPAVLLVVADLGIAPLLSTLLGGVGAVEDWEEWEWEWWECPEALRVDCGPPPVTRERREDALASVCGGLSW